MSIKVRLFRMAEKKRFTVTVPHGTYDLLRRWAKAEGSDAASQAAYILQSSIDEAKRLGKIPSEEGDSEIEQSIRRVLDYLFRQGGCRAPDNTDLFRFAESRGYPVGDVAKLIEERKEQCCETPE